ncbi:hypothetical protein DICA1_F12772 [Diutina catenulata]
MAGFGFLLGIAVCFISMVLVTPQYRDTASSMFGARSVTSFDAGVHEAPIVTNETKLTNEATYWTTLFNDGLSREAFASMSKADKCKTFFAGLAKENPDWKVDPNEYVGSYRNEIHDEWEFHHNSLLRSAIKDILYNHNIDEEDVERAEKRIHDALVEQDRNTTRRLTDIMTVVRMYNTCYLDPKLDGEFDDTEEIERRVFPYLTGKEPTFQLYDGPIQTEVPVYDASHQPREVKSQGFWNQYRSKFNGRGIVVTAYDHHDGELIAEIYNLRMLNTSLPMQVVHYNDIGPRFKEKIIRAARDPMPLADNPPPGVTPDMNPIEVWFVEVEESVDTDLRAKFHSFGNKFLAVMYNSFEEMLFLDCDLLVFKKPEVFFDMTGYKETGALFWQDRHTSWGLNRRDPDIYTALMPPAVEEEWFGTKQATNHTLGLNFFRFGTKERQESGVLVIDRMDHLSSLFMAAEIFFFDKTKHKFHGDKECFWLGFTINGDENYAWNKNAGATIGNPTKDRGWVFKSNNERRRSMEICSVQIAHIDSDDGELAWINGGGLNKGKTLWNNWENKYDERMRFDWIKSAEDFGKYGDSGLDPQYMLIPADDWERGIVGVHHDGHKPLGFNVEEEPVESWEMFGNLNALWCGRTTTGGRTEEGDSNEISGTLIELRPEVRDYVRYLSTLLYEQNMLLKDQRRKEEEEKEREHQAQLEREEAERIRLEQQQREDEARVMQQSIHDEEQRLKAAQAEGVPNT